jgi:hypothetical protein
VWCGRSIPVRGRARRQARSCAPARQRPPRRRRGTPWARRRPRWPQRRQFRYLRRLLSQDRRARSLRRRPRSRGWFPHFIRQQPPLRALLRPPRQRQRVPSRRIPRRLRRSPFRSALPQPPRRRAPWHPLQLALLCKIRSLRGRRYRHALRSRPHCRRSLAPAPPRPLSSALLPRCPPSNPQRRWR